MGIALVYGGSRHSAAAAPTAATAAFLTLPAIQRACRTPSSAATLPRS